MVSGSACLNIVKLFKHLTISFHAKFRGNPKRLLKLFSQYLKQDRSLSLDLFTFLKNSLMLEDVGQIRRLAELIYPGELFILTIKDRSSSIKEKNTAFQKIISKKVRLHSSHFLDENLADSLWRFAKSQQHPIEVVKSLRAEDSQISIFILSLAAKDLSGLSWKTFENSSPSHFEAIATTIPIQEVSSKTTTNVGSYIPTHYFQEPVCFEDNYARPERSVALPSPDCYEIKEATVYPGGQVFSQKQLVIYEPSANPLERNFISGLHGNLKALPQSSLVAAYFTYDQTVDIPEAVLISSRCPKNYFHWMIEYLPKIKTLVDLHQSHIPLLIESELAPQQMEAFDHFRQKWDLKVIQYNPKTRLRIDRLLVPNPLTNHPDDPEVPYWQGAALNKNYISFMRKELFDYSHSQQSSLKTFPRLFLARSSTNRGILNIEELYDIARELGYEVIFPERYTLAEQIHLLSHADTIVSHCGSSLVNAMFMKPGSQIFSLIADHNKTYSMYSNLVKFFDISYTHVTGQPLRPRSEFASEIAFTHSPFTIPKDKMRRALS